MINKDEQEIDAASINIGNICGGAVMDAFDLAQRKVMENIADPSTVATATRTITLRFDYKPESDRCKVHTEFTVVEKLSGIEKQIGHMFIARAENNLLVAIDTDPRQMKLWEAPQPKQVPVIKFKES